MLKLTEIGESSIILSLSYAKTKRALQACRALYEFAKDYPGVLSARCALDAVLLEHTESFDQRRFLQAAKKVKPLPPLKNSVLVRVPVCYDISCGKDLQSVAAAVDLDTRRLIALHQSQTYEVWMLGFMPGFPYMGELSKRLQLERKATPDPVITGGSVAIAEEYVGIYPFDSPGGWHVIGRTPWSIIDYSRGKPTFFESGMRIQFYSISHEEFESMKGKFHEEARD